MAAQFRGINVINLVRRHENVADLANFGITNGVSTSDPNWRETVAGMVQGKPILVAIDGVGGAASGDTLSMVGEGGLLVSCGAMSGKPMEIPPGDLIFRQASVKGFWFSKLRETTPLNETRRSMAELLGLVEKDVIRLQVDAIFNLNNIAEALQKNATPSRPGKILLRPQLIVVTLCYLFMGCIAGGKPGKLYIIRRRPPSEARRARTFARSAY
jgi:NADPH:quinone reductase-like Zn-dependent oxidoreductase